MPSRMLVNRELARIFAALSHPERLRIIEELGEGERDVHTLQTLLGVGQSRVSRHLTLLRATRLVQERRAGRHVYYRLAHPEMRSWVLEGLTFLERDAHQAEERLTAVEQARNLWSAASSAQH